MNDLTIQNQLTFSPDQIDLIKKTICPGASDNELKMFLHVANKVQLDPFVKQIYSIERRNKKPDGQWETKRQTMISIDGQRLVAIRSGQYAGQLGPFFCGKDGKWVDVWTDLQNPPYAAKVGALRHDFNEPLWAIAVFASYAQYKSNGQLNAFWERSPELMIAKCAEALALRKAFPDFLSGLYTIEELGTEDAQKPRSQLDKTSPTEKPKEEGSQYKNQSMIPEKPQGFPVFSFGQFKGRAINEIPLKEVQSYVKFLQSKDFDFNDVRNKGFFKEVARYICDDSFLIVKKKEEPIVFCWNCSESFVATLSECPACGANETDRPKDQGSKFTVDEIPF